MEKTLIFIRHGHRANNRFNVNNGLDEKGKRQADLIRHFFISRFGCSTAGGIRLVSSPKLRCIETIEPLAQALGLTVEVHSDLDEQLGGTSDSPLEARVERFLNDWRRGLSALTVACSHGDWIPVAVDSLLGIQLNPGVGSWSEISLLGRRASWKGYFDDLNHQKQ